MGGRGWWSGSAQPLILCDRVLPLQQDKRYNDGPDQDLHLGPRNLWSVALYTTELSGAGILASLTVKTLTKKSFK